MSRAAVALLATLVGPADQGSFRVELVGNGKVAGTYENDRVQWPVEGYIDEAGTARGQGYRDQETFRWVIAFERQCEQGALYPD